MGKPKKTDTNDAAAAAAAAAPPTANPANAPSTDATTGRPEDPAQTYPDVDAGPTPTPLLARWPTMEDLIVDLERHAARSHGLHADVELLRAVAAYLRETCDLPTTA